MMTDIARKKYKGSKTEKKKQISARGKRRGGSEIEINGNTFQSDPSTSSPEKRGGFVPKMGESRHSHNAIKRNN